MQDKFAEILPPRWLLGLVWDGERLSVTLGHTQNVFYAGDSLIQPPSANSSSEFPQIFFLLEF